MKLSELLHDIGRPVAYSPQLAILIGVKECVLLSQLLYWSDKAKEGWIYKSVEEMEVETGLSYNEQSSSRKSLTDNGLLLVRNDRSAHRLYFKVVTEKLDELWANRKSIRRSRDTEKATAKRWEASPSDVDGHLRPTDQASPSDVDGHLRPTDSDIHTETTGTETTNTRASAGGDSLKPVSGKNAKDFTDFIAWWDREFPKAHDGEKYIVQGGKDGSALKRLLSAGLTLDKLTRIALAAWKHSDLFNCKHAVTISGMVSRINEIRDELNTKLKPAAVSAAQEIRSLETERRPLAATLEEYNALLQHDCNRSQENINIRKAARERVKAIDARLAELRK